MAITSQKYVVKHNFIFFQCKYLLKIKKSCNFVAEKVCSVDFLKKWWSKNDLLCAATFNTPNDIYICAYP